MSDDMIGCQMSKEEWERIQTRKEEENRQLSALAALRDCNGVSAAMLDHAVAVIAEGLSTGQTDLRALMYRVVRDVLKWPEPGVALGVVTATVSHPQDI